MSNRESAMRLLAQIPDYKVNYVLAYLQGLAADEDADDAYCRALYEEHLAADDKDDTVSFEEACRVCGVDIDEIRNQA